MRSMWMPILGSCTRRDLVSRGGALVSAYHHEKVRGVARIMSRDLIECLRACRDGGRRDRNCR